MFSVNVGQGTPVTGTFAGINWGTNAKFMQVEIDPAGGSSYIDMGTQQMMSVPYALYASNVSAASLSNLLPPILAPISLVNIYLSATSVVFRSTIVSDGGNAVIARGIVWSTSPHPTVALSTKTIDSAGTGIYLSSASLLPSTLYYVRSYATNGIATGYSSDIELTTPPTMLGASYLGGVLAHIIQPGDSLFVLNSTHGSIMTPFDLDSAKQWGCYGTFVTGTSTAYGSGSMNTMQIVSSTCGSTSAAKLCSDLVLGGYDDWYLPSRDELWKLFLNRTVLGLPLSWYWTSSESSSTLSWRTQFDYSNSVTTDKVNLHRVRAIRSF
jgi:hypothetical protein